MGKLNNRSRNSKGQLTGWGYPIRYVGKKRKPEYLIDTNTWVTRGCLPERRAYFEKFFQSEKGYFKLMFHKMKDRHKDKGGRSGKFEFEDAEDLLNYWHKQQEKYGDKCPITDQTLTMIRFKQGREKRINTNISPDRLFSPITYTKQNVLFTCTRWNIAKGDLKFYQLPTYFKKELTDRFYKILHERYPELVDIGWEAVDGYE